MLIWLHIINIEVTLNCVYSPLKGSKLMFIDTLCLELCLRNILTAWLPKSSLGPVWTGFKPKLLFENTACLVHKHQKTNQDFIFFLNTSDCFLFKFLKMYNCCIKESMRIGTPLHRKTWYLGLYSCSVIPYRYIERWIDLVGKIDRYGWKDRYKRNEYR